MNAQWRRRRRENNNVGNPRREPAANSPGTTMLLLFAGVLFAVTAGFAAVTQLEQSGPSVGAIVVFKTGSAGTERWSVDVAIAEPTLLVWSGAAGTRRCSLSPTMMAAHGGSLAVEARRLSRPPVYRVHWAGGHTDIGTTDCGTSADLVLQRVELMRLANVAGGLSSGLRLIGP
jgi:hypothetical protein